MQPDETPSTRDAFICLDNGCKQHHKDLPCHGTRRLETSMQPDEPVTSIEMSTMCWTTVVPRTSMNSKLIL